MVYSFGQVAVSVKSASWSTQIQSCRGSSCRIQSCNDWERNCPGWQLLCLYVVGAVVIACCHCMCCCLCCSSILWGHWRTSEIAFLFELESNQCDCQFFFCICSSRGSSWQAWALLPPWPGVDGTIANLTMLCMIDCENVWVFVHGVSDLVHIQHYVKPWLSFCVR